MRDHTVAGGAADRPCLLVPLPPAPPAFTRRTLARAWIGGMITPIKLLGVGTDVHAFDRAGSPALRRHPGDPARPVGVEGVYVGADAHPRNRCDHAADPSTR